MIWAILVVTYAYHDEFYGTLLAFTWGLFVYSSFKVIAVILGIVGSFKKWSLIILLVCKIISYFKLVLIISRLCYMYLFGLFLKADFIVYGF